MIVPVSVVIPFYNNYHQIQKCIESLFSGTYIPNEVVVVNDGSLKKKIIRIKRVKYFYKKNGGPASARNYGALNSKNSWILFLDSDCWVNNFFFFKINKLIRKNRNFCGQYKLGIQKKLLSNFIDIDLGYRYSKMPRYVSLQGGYFLAVEKRKFLSLKGFNEFYKKPGGEDFELSCKYSRKYGKFFLSRSVKIFTYHESNLINYLKKIFYRSIVHYQLINRLKLNSKEDNYSSINDKIHIFLSSVIPITLILNFIYPYIFYILFDIKKYFDYIKFSKKKLNIKILIYFHLFGLIRSSIMVIGFILGYIKYNYLNNEKINQ